MWIPRDINCTADKLSKMVDFEDYSVTSNFFHVVRKISPFPLKTDCFASETTAKLPMYFSITYFEGTAGVDCFQYNWAPFEPCWIFPPPRLIMRAYHHLKLCRACGIILTPQWRNSAFYSLLEKTPPDNLLQKLVYDDTGIFKAGLDASSYFGPDYKGNVVLWVFNFKL